jgi:hypothetical protein
MSKFTNHRQKVVRWWQEYKFEVVIVAMGLASVNAIFISKAFRQSSTINPEAAGQLGSFVGGYIGAIFALTGVVLLFSTLKSQRIAFALQNFENKYFELIKMHRDNVAEIELQGASGRKVFVLLLRELRSALDVVREIAKTHKQQLTKQALLTVAYYCLFYGVGPNSSRMLKMSLSDFNAAFIDAVEKELNRSETKAEYRKDRNLDYVPFEGHQSRLGHYYRHLYQMIRYVDQQTLNIDKYEYVKTIRAQLSTHEEALLLVNSLTPIGRNWWHENLIVKYRLVQNIPSEFFDTSTELDAKTLFAPGYFEWQETSRNESVA